MIEPMQARSHGEHHGRLSDLFVVAAWIGLVTGLVEGVGWIVVREMGRLTHVGTEVLWIAPMLDGVVFLAAGAGLAVLRRIVRPRWAWVAAMFALPALAAINFVSLTIGQYLYRWVLVVFAVGLATAFLRVFEAHEERALRFFRRSLPRVAGVVLALLVGVQSYSVLRERWRVNALPQADEAAPDVVVVVIDALRADHVSAYGYDRPTSPFLDELARNGVLFERAVSASPYSLPSHASMLSGLHTFEHGTEWLEFRVFRDAAYPSIAEAMRDRGYRTGAFSANPFWFTREEGFGRGFIRFEDFYHSVPDMAYRTVFGNNFNTFKFLLGFEQVPARKLGEESTDRVLDWVTRDPERPVFAFINYFDVHAPYTPPQPFRSRFSDQEAPGGILNGFMDRRGEIYLTPEERLSEIDGYDGALAYVDTELRRLWSELRLARPDRELLFVVTSDHGEAFGEHGGYIHGRSLYREELHIPLILRGPGVPSGVRIARPVTHAALPATILDIVSNGRAATFGSPSLAPLWSDPASQSTWSYPLAEAWQKDWTDSTFPVQSGDMRSLVGPEWHVIFHEVLPTELYSWDDARESRDRAGDPELRSVVDAFEALLPDRAGARAPGAPDPP